MKRYKMEWNTLQAVKVRFLHTLREEIVYTLVRIPHLGDHLMQ